MCRKEKGLGFGGAHWPIQAMENQAKENQGGEEEQVREKAGEEVGGAPASQKMSQRFRVSGLGFRV